MLFSHNKDPMVPNGSNGSDLCWSHVKTYFQIRILILYSVRVNGEQVIYLIDCIIFIYVQTKKLFVALNLLRLIVFYSIEFPIIFIRTIIIIIIFPRSVLYFFALQKKNGHWYRCSFPHNTESWSFSHAPNAIISNKIQQWWRRRRWRKKIISIWIVIIHSTSKRL